MRASIVIASHDEGRNLVRTVAGVREIAWILDLEIVVVDDGSRDGSVETVRRQAPEVRVVETGGRLGSAPAKDIGARSARGEVLVFLDAHTKPEEGAIFRLVRGVEEAGGDAILAPRIMALDVETWENRPDAAGYGFALLLPDLEGRWLPPSALRLRGSLYESPCLCGCAFAIFRKLYDELRGFDRDMIEYGPEDIDFGLKSWLLGHPILVDPLASVGHRFVGEFPYRVAPESVLANKARIARKNFTEAGYRDWLRVFGAAIEPGLWERALALYRTREESAEEEREYLLARRVHDETWLARTFACAWPAAQDPPPPVADGRR